MIVHVPCPGEPAPSLLSPLLRSLPVSEITTHPVFVVSAKLVFEVFTNVVPLWVCGTTLRQLLENLGTTLRHLRQLLDNFATSLGLHSDYYPCPQHMANIEP